MSHFICVITPSPFYHATLTSIFLSFFFIFHSSTLLFRNFINYTHTNLGEINNDRLFFELSDAYPYLFSLSHPQVHFLSAPSILHAPSPSICTQTLNSKRSRGLVTLCNLWQGRNPGTQQLAPNEAGLSVSSVELATVNKKSQLV